MAATIDTKAERLVAIGGSRWERNGMNRVYFDDLAGWYGLSVETYNSGHVRSAALDGRAISNGEARRIAARLANTKLWWDAADDRFHGSGLDPDDLYDLTQAVNTAMTAAK